MVRRSRRRCSRDSVRVDLKRRVAALTLVTSFTVAPPQRTERISVVDAVPLRLADGARMNDASFCADDAVAVASTRPNRVSVFDTTGRALWSVDVRGDPFSVTCVNNTVAIIENDDEWELVVYSRGRSVESSRTPLDLPRASTARILGARRDAWLVEVEARHTAGGPPIALVFPERAVRLYRPGVSGFTQWFMKRDSTLRSVPTTNNAPSRYAIRSPFEAVPYLALLSKGTFAFSRGVGLEVHELDTAGNTLRTTKLLTGPSKLTRERAESLALAWPLRGSPIAPESLFRRIVASDTQYVGIALGRFVCSEQSACLVHRRDLDDNPITATGVRSYDAVPHDDRPSARFSVDSGISLVGWRRNFLVVKRRQGGSDASVSESVMLLRFAPEWK